MRLWRMLLVFIIIAPTSAWAGSFYIEASRVAIVREVPLTDSLAIARLQPGDTAACIVVDGHAQREANHFQIKLGDGRIGWVSRYRVRLREGASPSALPNATLTTADQLRAYHLEIGQPLGYIELINEGYVVGYDPRLKIPVWVQYRIRASDLLDPVSRSDAFEADTRIPRPGRALLADYAEAASWDLWNELDLQPPQQTRPAYARGHMAPSRDLARTADVERSSNLLSNIAPQVHFGYNSGVWSTLENRVRRWTEERGELTIIMGPVFISTERQLSPLKEDADRIVAAEDQGLIVLAQPATERQVIYNVVGDGEVAVPTAFFKVIVDHADPDNPDVLAFLIPHYRHTGPELGDFLVSVREIERLTGLNLLSSLSKDVQDRIETKSASSVW